MEQSHKCEENSQRLNTDSIINRPFYNRKCEN